MTAESRTESNIESQPQNQTDVPTVGESRILPSTGQWRIDSTHSTVTFAVRHHAIARFRSVFANVSGSFDAGQRRLSGSVAVADIALPGKDRLREHLLSGDFFAAERFPTLSFASTQITEDQDLLLVDGTLTLRGVSQPVTASGACTAARSVTGGSGKTTRRFGLDLRTSIDRRDFGISFNNFIADGVANLGWIVEIDAALELILEHA